MFLAGLDMSLSDFPPIVRNLVVAAVGVAAFMSIWERLKGRNLLKRIFAEVQTNGGVHDGEGTLKDFMVKCSEDSAKALTASYEGIEQNKRILRRQSRHITRTRHLELQGEEIKTRVGNVEKSVEDEKLRLARALRHMVANDLQGSQLMKEADEFIARIEQERKGKNS